MKLSKLLANVKTQSPYREREISAIAVNSGDVCAGALFIAIRGMKSDGHDYAADALMKGAACVLAERKIAGIPEERLIITDNCRAASAKIYSAFYGDPGNSMRLVAVTGTNGKTTVAKLTEHILRYAGYKTGFVGTTGVTIDTEAFSPASEGEECPALTMTTPSPEYLYKALYEMKKAGCEIVVAEASSHALALSRLDALSFEAGIFMNLSRDHLDFHGNEENYFNAKKKLASMSKLFIVNYDDKYGQRLKNEYKSAFAFSAVPETAADDNVFATACACKNLGVEGMEYLFYSANAIFKAKTKMWGMNGVYNSMAASLAALLLGVAPVTVQGALSCFDGVCGRMEVLPSAEGEATFIIDYAHTPDALEKALLSVREAVRGGRLVLVFGCGGERDRSKREMMGAAADKYADFTYVTNDNPRGEDPAAILEMIERGFCRDDNHTVIADRRDALTAAVNQSRKGDFVLVCGKGHENYIIDGEGKKYFSEREIIAKALKDKRSGPSL